MVQIDRYGTAIDPGPGDPVVEVVKPIEVIVVGGSLNLEPGFPSRWPEQSITFRASPENVKRIRDALTSGEMIARLDFRKLE